MPATLTCVQSITYGGLRAPCCRRPGHAWPRTMRRGAPRHRGDALGAGWPGTGDRCPRTECGRPEQDLHRICPWPEPGRCGHVPRASASGPGRVPDLRSTAAPDGATCWKFRCSDRPAVAGVSAPSGRCPSASWPGGETRVLPGPGTAHPRAHRRPFRAGSQDGRS